MEVLQVTHRHAFIEVITAGGERVFTILRVLHGEGGLIVRIENRLAQFLQFLQKFCLRAQSRAILQSLKGRCLQLLRREFRQEFLRRK